MVNLVNYPTLQAECHDTEARSLKKINDLEVQQAASLATLTSPGGSAVAITNYVYGVLYTIPPGADLLDVACYNPGANDCWVFVMITPGPATPGQRASFPIRVYAGNHAYYEAMTSHFSVASGMTFSICVSSTQDTLTWNPVNVYLAIRHS